MGRSFLEGRSYVRGRAPNLNRLSRARKHLVFSLIQYSRSSQLCVCLIRCSARGRLWEGRFLKEDRIFVEELRT